MFPVRDHSYLYPLPEHILVHHYGSLKAWKEASLLPKEIYQQNWLLWLHQFLSWRLKWICSHSSEVSLLISLLIVLNMNPLCKHVCHDWLYSLKKGLIWKTYSNFTGKEPLNKSHREKTKHQKTSTCMQKASGFSQSQWIG